MDSIEAARILAVDERDAIAHRVVLHDDTLRDGEQTIGVSFSVEQKVELAKRLIASGITSFLPGFPAISEQEKEAVRAILALGGPASDLLLFARATKNDIEAVIDCGASGVSMFIPLSDSHLRYKLGIDVEGAYEKMIDSIALAKSYGLRIRFSFEDCTRAPIERVKRFAGAAAEAADPVDMSFADTVGVLTPLTTYAFVKELLSVMGGVPMMVHFHNDLGMATANALTAAVAGATLLSGTLCGLGERAGNANIEEMAVTLRVKYGLAQDVDLVKLAETARWVAELTRFPLAYNKPVLGRNVFSHETGIHVHGLMRERCTYEPFPPELVGAAHEIHYGKHSGLGSMAYLARVNGIDASEEAMQEALAVIKELGTSGRVPSPAKAARILRAAVEKTSTPER